MAGKCAAQAAPTAQGRSSRRQTWWCASLSEWNSIHRWGPVQGFVARVGGLAEDSGGDTQRLLSRPARRNTSRRSIRTSCTCAAVQLFASAPLAWTRDLALAPPLAAIMPSITRLTDVVGERRPLPDVAIDIGIDDAPQKRAELACCCDAPGDIRRLRRQFFALVQAAGHSSRCRIRAPEAALALVIDSNTVIFRAARSVEYTDYSRPRYVES